MDSSLIINEKKINSRRLFDKSSKNLDSLDLQSHSSNFRSFFRNRSIKTIRLTCKGNIDDPDFANNLKKIVQKLKLLLFNGKKFFKITKVEPWNSVRVTLNLSDDAAQRLRQLAEHGDENLRDIGVLSVQLEGQQIISLVLPNQNIVNNNQDASNDSSVLPSSKNDKLVDDENRNFDDEKIHQQQTNDKDNTILYKDSQCYFDQMNGNLLNNENNNLKQQKCDENFSTNEEISTMKMKNPIKNAIDDSDSSTHTESLTNIYVSSNNDLQHDGQTTPTNSTQLVVDKASMVSHHQSQVESSILTASTDTSSMLPETSLLTKRTQESQSVNIVSNNSLSVRGMISVQSNKPTTTGALLVGVGDSIQKEQSFSSNRSGMISPSAVNISNFDQNNMKSTPSSINLTQSSESQHANTPVPIYSNQQQPQSQTFKQHLPETQPTQSQLQSRSYPPSSSQTTIDHFNFLHSQISSDQSVSVFQSSKNTSNVSFNDHQLPTSEAIVGFNNKNVPQTTSTESSTNQANTGDILGSCLDAVDDDLLVSVASSGAETSSLSDLNDLNLLSMLEEMETCNQSQQTQQQSSNVPIQSSLMNTNVTSIKDSTHPANTIVSSSAEPVAFNVKNDICIPHSNTVSQSSNQTLFITQQKSQLVPTSTTKLVASILSNKPSVLFNGPKGAVLSTSQPISNQQSANTFFASIQQQNSALGLNAKQHQIHQSTQLSQQQPFSQSNSSNPKQIYLPVRQMPAVCSSAVSQQVQFSHPSSQAPSSIISQAQQQQQQQNRYLPLNTGNGGQSLICQTNNNPNSVQIQQQPNRPHSTPATSMIIRQTSLPSSSQNQPTSISGNVNQQQPNTVALSSPLLVNLLQSDVPANATSIQHQQHSINQQQKSQNLSQQQSQQFVTSATPQQIRFLSPAGSGDGSTQVMMMVRVSAAPQGGTTTQLIHPATGNVVSVPLSQQVGNSPQITLENQQNNAGTAGSSNSKQKKPRKPRKSKTQTENTGVRENIIQNQANLQQPVNASFSATISAPSSHLTSSRAQTSSSSTYITLPSSTVNQALKLQQQSSNSQQQAFVTTNHTNVQTLFHQHKQRVQPVVMIAAPQTSMTNNSSESNSSVVSVSNSMVTSQSGPTFILTNVQAGSLSNNNASATAITSQQSSTSGIQLSGNRKQIFLATKTQSYPVSSALVRLNNKFVAPSSNTTSSSVTLATTNVVTMSSSNTNDNNKAIIASALITACKSSPSIATTVSSVQTSFLPSKISSSMIPTSINSNTENKYPETPSNNNNVNVSIQQHSSTTSIFSISNQMQRVNKSLQSSLLPSSSPSTSSSCSSIQTSGSLINSQQANVISSLKTFGIPNAVTTAASSLLLNKLSHSSNSKILASFPSSQTTNQLISSSSKPLKTLTRISNAQKPFMQLKNMELVNKSEDSFSESSDSLFLLKQPVQTNEVSNCNNLDSYLASGDLRDSNSKQTSHQSTLVNMLNNSDSTRTTFQPSMVESNKAHHTVFLDETNRVSEPKAPLSPSYFLTPASAFENKPTEDESKNINEKQIMEEQSKTITSEPIEQSNKSNKTTSSNSMSTDVKPSNSGNTLFANSEKSQTLSQKLTPNKNSFDYFYSSSQSRFTQCLPDHILDDDEEDGEDSDTDDFGFYSKTSHFLSGSVGSIGGSGNSNTRKPSSSISDEKALSQSISTTAATFPITSVESNTELSTSVKHMAPKETQSYLSSTDKSEKADVESELPVKSSFLNDKMTDQQTFDVKQEVDGQSLFENQDQSVDEKSQVNIQNISNESKVLSAFKMEHSDFSSDINVVASKTYPSAKADISEIKLPTTTTLSKDNKSKSLVEIDECDSVEVSKSLNEDSKIDFSKSPNVSIATKLSTKKSLNKSLKPKVSSSTLLVSPQVPPESARPFVSQQSVNLITQLETFSNVNSIESLTLENEKQFVSANSKQQQQHAKLPLTMNAVQIPGQTLLNSTPNQSIPNENPTAQTFSISTAPSNAKFKIVCVPPSQSGTVDATKNLRYLVQSGGQFVMVNPNQFKLVSTTANKLHSSVAAGTVGTSQQLFMLQTNPSNNPNIVKQPAVAASNLQVAPSNIQQLNRETTLQKTLINEVDSSKLHQIGRKVQTNSSNDVSQLINDAAYTTVSHQNSEIDKNSSSGLDSFVKANDPLKIADSTQSITFLSVSQENNPSSQDILATNQKKEVSSVENFDNDSSLKPSASLNVLDLPGDHGQSSCQPTVNSVDHISDIQIQQSSKTPIKESQILSSKQTSQSRTVHIMVPTSSEVSSNVVILKADNPPNKLDSDNHGIVQMSLPVINQNSSSVYKRQILMARATNLPSQQLDQPVSASLSKTTNALVTATKTLPTILRQSKRKNEGNVFQLSQGLPSTPLITGVDSVKSSSNVDLTTHSSIDFSNEPNIDIHPPSVSGKPDSSKEVSLVTVHQQVATPIEDDSNISDVSDTSLKPRKRARKSKVTTIQQPINVTNDPQVYLGNNKISIESSLLNSSQDEVQLIEQIQGVSRNLRNSSSTTIAIASKSSPAQKRGQRSRSMLASNSGPTHSSPSVSIFMPSNDSTNKSGENQKKVLETNSFAARQTRSNRNKKSQDQFNLVNNVDNSSDILTSNQVNQSVHSSSHTTILNNETNLSSSDSTNSIQIPLLTTLSNSQQEISVLSTSSLHNDQSRGVISLLESNNNASNSTSSSSNSSNSLLVKRSRKLQISVKPTLRNTSVSVSEQASQSPTIKRRRLAKNEVSK